LVIGYFPMSYFSVTPLRFKVLHIELSLHASNIYEHYSAGNCKTWNGMKCRISLFSLMIM